MSTYTVEINLIGGEGTVIVAEGVELGAGQIYVKQVMDEGFWEEEQGSHYFYPPSSYWSVSVRLEPEPEPEDQ